MNRYTVLKIAVLLVAFLTLFLALGGGEHRNPLKKLGVRFEFFPAASPTLTLIDFWIESDSGKINGPGFTGEELAVKFHDENGDGIDEIIVRSKTIKDSFAIIQVFQENGKATRFHILKENRICMGFPEEGYLCP